VPAQSPTLAGWLTQLSFECGAGATDVAPKMVSWAQGTAHSLENFFPHPHQPFQLKKGLSLALLTSECAENSFL